MKRRFVPAFVLAILVVLGSVPAAAGEKWCEEDPVLTIDGRIVNFTASFPASNLQGATIVWTFHIPKNVLLAAAITPPALGSPAIPTRVRIYRDLPAYGLLASATVLTTVTVVGNGAFPTSTSVMGLNARWTTYSGYSNQITTFATRFSTLPLLW
jgi:hypothetical protein